MGTDHGQSVSQTLVMKVLLLSCLISLACARPRYLVIDLDSMSDSQPLPISQPVLGRQARMAQQQDPGYQVYDRMDIAAAPVTRTRHPLVLTMLTTERTLEVMERSAGTLIILCCLLDTDTYYIYTLSKWGVLLKQKHWMESLWSLDLGFGGGRG